MGAGSLVSFCRKSSLLTVETGSECFRLFCSVLFGKVQRLGSSVDVDIGFCVSSSMWASVSSTENRIMKNYDFETEEFKNNGETIFTTYQLLLFLPSNPQAH